MTLIFSHVNPDTGLFALSDILASRPTQADPAPISIPFRQEPLKHANAGYSLAGTIQKSVIFGRTLVLFAGTVVVARAVIEHIRSASDEGQNEIDLLELLDASGLSAKELDAVSLIYHYTPPGPQLHRTQWNCEKIEMPGADELFGAGTGVWNFFENHQSTSSADRPDHERVLASLLARLSAHPLYEANNRESLDHLYGGWFELAHRDDATFTKVPYAVRFWARQGGVLFSGGPIHFAWYRDNTLTVSRFQFVEENGVRSLKQDLDIVPDFLGRDRGGPPKAAIRPYFFIHIVHDLDEQDAVHTLIDHQIESEGMILEVSPKGVRVAETHELRKRLLDLGSRDAAQTLSRKYD
jgi:hypothetical protein